MYNRNKPSIKLQAFFRRHFNNVTFIEGTVLDISTLKLAKVSAAEFNNSLYCEHAWFRVTFYVWQFDMFSRRCKRVCLINKTDVICCFYKGHFQLKYERKLRQFWAGSVQMQFSADYWRAFMFCDNTTGKDSDRGADTGRQVCSQRGWWRRSQHHASDSDQELSKRCSYHHSAAAVSQQGRQSPALQSAHVTHHLYWPLAATALCRRKWIVYIVNHS